MKVMLPKRTDTRFIQVFDTWTRNGPKTDESNDKRAIEQFIPLDRVERFYKRGRRHRSEQEICFVVLVYNRRSHVHDEYYITEELYQILSAL